MQKVIRQREFWIFLLLNLVTCGIYGLYFWYVWNEDVNHICEGDGQAMPNYVVVILLGLVTCGIYFYYWVYKQGNRLQENAVRYGIRIQENGNSFLLWSLLSILTCSLAQYYAYYLMIQAVNQIAPGYNRANGYDDSYGNAQYTGGYQQSGYSQNRNEQSGYYQNGYQQNRYQQMNNRQAGYNQNNWQMNTMSGQVTGRGQILCIVGPEVSRITVIQDAQTLTLGQDGSVCNHIIMGNRIEAKHCSITYRKWDNMYLVTDHSLSGTYVTEDDRRLPPETMVELSAGTEIYLGDRATVYRLG